MFNTRFALMAGLLTVGAVSSQAAWYTTEASFLSAITGDYHLEDFGSITSYGFLGGTFGSAGNGYSWTADATPGGGLYGIVPGGNGALSTLNSTDKLRFTFTGGKAVKAFGGFFFNSDDPGNFISGDITIDTGSGTYTISTSNTTTFLGWVGSAALVSATVEGDNNTVFPSADHVYVGQPVPEPFTMALALGGLGVAAARRRRRS